MAAKHVDRPDVVMIGIHVYQIEWLSIDEWRVGNHDVNALGATNPDLNKMYIQHQTGMPESCLQDTLLHEIQHAVWASLGINHQVPKVDNDDVEEFIIAGTTPWLVGILKDNPHVVKYLTSDGTVVRS